MSMSGSTKACDDDVDIGDGKSVAIASSRSSSLRFFVVVGLTEAPPSTRTALMAEEDPLNVGLDEDSLSRFFFFSFSSVVVVAGMVDVDEEEDVAMVVGVGVGVPPFDLDVFFRGSLVLSRALALIALVPRRPTSFAFKPAPGFSPSESLLSLLESVAGPFFLGLIAADDDERFSVFG